ncbi:rod shape-determining protein MreC [Paenibacillus alkalitolerans]|uniref:rod shape-determining protein MreC n=1 Tax=Paenibacillus alkalitolerans TaxID=2799335 RepID=UPI0018F6EE74|nr:rod shape-determining protein MreC [Paenibacillus alkalitolerans]
MFKLMGNKRLFILLVAIMVFIAVMGFTLGGRGGVSWPEKFVADTVAFGQGLIYKPVRSVAGFFEDIRMLKIIYEENRTLRLTLAQYARDTARLNDLQAQNERLKEALEFTERQKNADNYKYHIAEVIGVSPDPYNSTVKINLGERDGMKTDMAVVTVDGLIGRIVRVTPFTSNVQLITDLNGVEGTKAISATVKDSETDSFGMIESYDKENGLLVMTKIDPGDKQLGEGDTVITSGLGELFPHGLVIGTVVSRDVGQFGLTYNAMVKPAAQFTKLREVFVVEVPEN